MTDGRKGAETQTQDDLLVRRKRALYRAQHRGTKEMDWMIGRYGEARLGTMTGGELQTFELFLEIADPEINAWLLEPGRCPEPAFAEVIADIRIFNSLV